MNLRDLLINIPVQQSSGNLLLNISGIAQDSRSVKPGDLFLCVKGARFNGHHYLKQAAEAGAVAAIVSEWPTCDFGLTLVLVPEVTNPVIKEIAGAFYGYPDRRLKLIGVVGTNGKTTSTYLMKSILEAAGHKVGLIGTIANLAGDQSIETGNGSHNTTPGVLELQKLFAAMAEAGIQYVVMEVSSHSIAQDRVWGLSFIGGIFTNITQDHLDYHKTFAEYLKVKSRFFVELPQTAWAVLNLDDPHSNGMISQTSARVLTYGIEHPAQIKAEDVSLEHTGVSYHVCMPDGKIKLNLHLTGYFNVYNSLGVFGAGLALGIEPATIKIGLEKVMGVPGRFQTVPGASSFGVIVDYAHTPDGLENILATARRLTSQRLLLVFGCGGDRDRTKRPLMGELAAKMSDFTIITSDNPRTENPLSIIQEIEAGFKKANPAASYQVEPDREKAIRKIIGLANDSDIVIIAGKGHETYQEFADRTIHFDDREIARAALEERLNDRNRVK
ncbi:UDP-N-acetylmuramoylalanyl-D-glutamate--2,6-diaminopimelate ligase [Hydrogenispora ethanolica]|uniref:UDP-N-acetylmuramoyl-L-alanyl-D-glutamate--2,6-diaminopimelate ligase n=1 Tax=Hydrogenispora ethanolica TaxID=1082276 RepID=A0A4R1QZ60_HYDET|nr:UDP-N-acetylmuramoyl-L-alanyl-D-glutamate--2,6-diaminopimelate ligase [Hydrogenispora ethanolica]TCL58275.1 UDP-N-acetylmuramoylalanyl-D-glutamate--2,6-diaminopimelate ligase [Hydrogenispora ethanolica]